MGVARREVLRVPPYHNNGGLFREIYSEVTIITFFTKKHNNACCYPVQITHYANLIGLLPDVRLIDADYIDVEEKSQQVGKSSLDLHDVVLTCFWHSASACATLGKVSSR
jgi:hypothetical protein